MAAAIGLREDYDAGAVRAAAKRSKDGPQARRLLALAAIYDGATRTEAATIGGVTLQVVRDWVLKFNGHGPNGLIDRKAPGQAARLNAEHRAALADRRSLPMGFRGIPHRGVCADAQPRVARNGVSQALGPPAPSCPGRGRHRGF